MSDACSRGCKVVKDCDGSCAIGVTACAPAADTILRELVEADAAWKALHPVLRLQEMDKGETRLAAAWKAARAHVSGVSVMDGAQAAEKLREDTRRHGHCPSCHALHPQHHANCTHGVPACPKCGQKDEGQTGEYACPECGLPTVWDGGCPAGVPASRRET